MSLVKAQDINVSKITTSKPKSLENGAKLVYVNYDGGRFNVQTPWTDVPWDSSCYTEGPWPKYSFEVSFRGMDTNPKIKAFHDKILEIEEKLVEEGIKNGVSWFKLEKSKCTKDVVGSKFGAIVKVSKDKETGEPDGKWPSTMKLKIPYRDNKFGCKLFSKQGEQYLINNANPDHPLEEVLVKNSKVRCIIRCVGLWIAHGTYMCQWELDRAEVEIPEATSNQSFLPDSDDEDEEFNVMNSSSSSSNSGPKMLADSDDEEEQEVKNEDSEEEEELEPQPLVATPTKVVKKKKVVKKGK